MTARPWPAARPPQPPVGPPPRLRRTGRPPALTVALLAVALAAGLLIARLPLATAAALLLGAAAVLLAVAQPLAGLALALLLGPWGALQNVALGSTLFDVGQLALLLTLAAWLGAALARRRLVVPRTPLNAPWALFVLIGLLSLLDAPSVELGVIELVKWLQMAAVVWLVVDLAHDPTRPATARLALPALTAALFLAGLSQALIGIWQFGLRGDGPEHFLVLGRFYRAYGTFEQPNPFGGYMNLTALPALGLLWGLLAAWRAPGGPWPGGRRRAALPALAFVALCAAATTLALLFSWSRGAWLGFLAGAAVLALFSARRPARGLLLATAAAVVLGGGLLLGEAAGFGPALSVAGRLGGFVGQFTLGDMRGVDITVENFPVLERLAHWQAAVDMARDDLWTGVGFGNYAAAYPAYALINWPDALGHAHNYYLTLLAEVGAPGLLAYLVFWLAVVAQTARAARRLAWPWRGLAVGLLAAWAALAVHHLVDKLYVNNVYIHLGALLAVLQLLAAPGAGAGASGIAPDRTAK